MLQGWVAGVRWAGFRLEWVRLAGFRLEWVWSKGPCSKFPVPGFRVGGMVSAGQKSLPHVPVSPGRGNGSGPCFFQALLPVAIETLVVIETLACPQGRSLAGIVSKAGHACPVSTLAGRGLCLFLGQGYGIHDHLAGRLHAIDLFYPGPFARFEVLVMGEKVNDFLDFDFRHVRDIGNIVIGRG